MTWTLARQSLPWRRAGILTEAAAQGMKILPDLPAPGKLYALFLAFLSGYSHSLGRLQSWTKKYSMKRARAFEK